MFNEFGSYNNALENSKNSLTHKLNDRQYCTNETNEFGRAPVPPANLPIPASSWNYPPPYLGNFYNSYYNNSSYDLTNTAAAAAASIATTHQYDSQKCGGTTDTSPQYHRNYSQQPHPTIPATSVLQCCDPRCQLLSDHSKYSLNQPLNNKLLAQRSKCLAKNYYGIGNSNGSSINTNSGCSIMDLPKPEPIKSTPDSSTKYPVSAASCISYPVLHNDLSNKYAHQTINCGSSSYNNQTTTTTLKPSKHMLFPETTPYIGDYYPEFGKSSYWNKKTFWNRNLPPPPSYYSAFSKDKNVGQKIIGSFEQTNSSSASPTGSGTGRGILFNRLLEHREHSYDGYIPSNYYPYAKSNQFGKVGSSFNGQAYLNHSRLANTTRPAYNGSCQPSFPSICNTPQYTSATDPLPPEYYKDHQDPVVPTITLHPTIPTSSKEIIFKPPEDRNKSSKILEQHPNLDVREFLSTWDDDIEDEKVPENNAIPNETQPVIVLDCTTLEGDVLAKVKEKIGGNIASCDIAEEFAVNLHDTTRGSSDVKVIENSSKSRSPRTSVIQENNAISMRVSPGLSENGDPKQDCPISTPDKSTTAESSHLNSDGNLTWYSNQSKKNEDISYNLVEMTERLVNTVDRLFNDTDKAKPPISTQTKPASCQETNDMKAQKDIPTGDEWQNNTNYKHVNTIDKSRSHSSPSPLNMNINQPVMNTNSSNDPNLAGNYPQYHYTVAHGNGNYNILKPAPKLKDTLPQHIIQYQGDQQLPYENSQAKKDTSYNLNLQKSNNDFRFSINYSKQQNDCNTPTVQDFSLKYQNISNGNEFNNDPTYVTQLNEYFKYNGEKHGSNEFSKNSSLPDYNAACRYGSSEITKNCTFRTSMDVTSANLKQCPSINYNGGKETNANDDTDITSVRADLEKSLNEITHQYNFHKQSAVDQTPLIQFDSSSLNHDQSYSSRSLAKIDDQYCSVMPAVSSVNDESSYNGVIQKTSFCTSSVPITSSSDIVLSTPSSTPTRATSTPSLAPITMLSIPSTAPVATSAISSVVSTLSTTTLPTVVTSATSEAPIPAGENIATGVTSSDTGILSMPSLSPPTSPRRTSCKSAPKQSINKDDSMKTMNLTLNDIYENKIVFSTTEEHRSSKSKAPTSSVNEMIQPDAESSKDMQTSPSIMKSPFEESTDFVSQQPLNLAVSKMDRISPYNDLISRCNSITPKSNDEEQFSIKNEAQENISRSNCDDGYSSAETIITEVDEHRGNTSHISRSPSASEKSPHTEPPAENSTLLMVTSESCPIPLEQCENAIEKQNEDIHLEMHAEDLTFKTSLLENNLDTIDITTGSDDVGIPKSSVITSTEKLQESVSFDKEINDSDDGNKSQLLSTCKVDINDSSSNSTRGNIPLCEASGTSLEPCSEEEIGNLEKSEDCSNSTNSSLENNTDQGHSTSNTESKGVDFPVSRDIESLRDVDGAPFDGTSSIQSLDNRFQVALNGRCSDAVCDHLDSRKHKIAFNDLPVKKRKQELSHPEMNTKNEAIYSSDENNSNKLDKIVDTDIQSNSSNLIKGQNVEYSSLGVIENSIPKDEKYNEPKSKKLKKKFLRKKLRKKKLRKKFLLKKAENIDRKKSLSPIYSLSSPFLSKTDSELSSVEPVRSPCDENNGNDFEFQEKRQNQFSNDEGSSDKPAELSTPSSPIPMEESNSSWSPQCPSPGRSFLDPDSITKAFSVAPSTPTSSWSSVCNDVRTPESVEKPLSPVRLEENDGPEADMNDCFSNIPSVAPTPNCDLIRDGTGDFDTSHSLNWSANETPILREFEIPTGPDNYSAPTPKCSLKQDESRVSGDEEDVELSSSCYTKRNARCFEDISGFDSKAPSPDCILNNDLDGTGSKSPYSNNLGVDHQQFENDPVIFQSDTSSPSSVAPSPNCSIVEGVLFDDYSSSSTDTNLKPASQISTNDTSTLREVEESPTRESQITMAELCTTLGDTNENDIDEIVEVTSLKDFALKALISQAKPASSEDIVCDINQCLVELREKPQHTEVIIHSNLDTSTSTQLDDDVERSRSPLFSDGSNVDNISPVSPSESVHLNNTVQVDSENECYGDNGDLCQCPLVNNGEAILCLRCSRYSSSTTNKDQLDTQNHESFETMSTTSSQEGENFTNCIEESFIDQKIDCSLDQSNNSIDENNWSHMLDNNVTIYQNAQKATNMWDNVKAEVKVHLPWDKIFNLTDTNTVGGQDLTMLELGPAKIEVRGENFWNSTCITSNKNSSPFVKVKRLVVQRADSMEEVMKHNGKIEEIDISGAEETVETTTFESEIEEQMVDEEMTDSIIDVNADNAEGGDLSCGIPRMVIKKTNCREYRSYLRVNANIHPVVRLYKSRSLDELARKYLDENSNLSDSTPVRSYPKVERSLTDCDTRFWRWQEKKNDQLSGSADQTSDAEHTDRIHEKQSENFEQIQLTASDIGERLEEDHDVKLKKVVKRRSHSRKLERHHCLLCHRSYPDKESYNTHIRGKYHRHLELTQRKTIHALYRHFTGNVCPSLRPLSIKERKRMKWKPRNATFNHFYHQKTPLQIALRESVSAD